MKTTGLEVHGRCDLRVGLTWLLPLETQMHPRSPSLQGDGGLPLLSLAPQLDGWTTPRLGLGTISTLDAATP